MARPREFVEEDALDGAMQIFWQKGYGATNLPDLLAAMGLTRGSFYKAFKDKRSVYVAALKHYDQQIIDGAVSFLAEAKEGESITRIFELFSKSLENHNGKDGAKGCLVCNAMVEMAPTDAEVAELTAQIFDRLQQAFFNVLLEDPTFSTTGEPELQHKSAWLANLYFGIQAVGKTGKVTPPLKDAISAFLSSKN